MRLADSPAARLGSVVQTAIGETVIDKVRLALVVTGFLLLVAELVLALIGVVRFVPPQSAAGMSASRILVPGLAFLACLFGGFALRRGVAGQTVRAPAGAVIALLLPTLLLLPFLPIFLRVLTAAVAVALFVVAVRARKRWLAAALLAVAIVLLAGVAAALPISFHLGILTRMIPYLCTLLYLAVVSLRGPLAHKPD